MSESTSHEIELPQGYDWSDTLGGPAPWFNRDSKIVLLCHSDGSVTWEMRDKKGRVLEP